MTERSLPRFYYHVTTRQAFRAVMRTGLVPWFSWWGREFGGAVFLWASRQSADTYSHMFERLGRDPVVLRVRVPSSWVFPDPTPSHGEPSDRLMTFRWLNPERLEADP